jgi:hypothetical protein
MAISTKTETYGLLSYWRELMEEDIWRFNQAIGESAPDKGCPVYIQPERERLGRILNKSFNRVSKQLGFSILPVWDSKTFVLQEGVPYERQIFTLDHNRYVEAFGQRATTLIEAAAAIVYTDEDGDGVDDTGTLTVVTAVDPDEIQVFFQAADGAPEAESIYYRVYPERITSDGVTATIVIHRADLVQPAVWAEPFSIDDPNRTVRNYADMADALDFVAALDVYRVYTDTTTPVVIHSDRYLEGYTTSLDTFTDTTGSVQLVDAVLGEFRIRHSCSNVPRYPERFTVYFKAGYPLNDGRIEEALSEAVIRIANADNPVPRWCAMCEQTKIIWQGDQYLFGRDELQRADVDNPFGLKSGQVLSWRTLQDFIKYSGGGVLKG